MDYQNLIQELSSPKPIWENGAPIGFKPPSALELRASRAIGSLLQVVAGLTGAVGPVQEVQKEKNEDRTSE
jgi:hypothetical protein